MGSITLTWWVKRVTKPVRKPHRTPITVPPKATTKNDAMPVTKINLVLEIAVTQNTQETIFSIQDG